MTSCLLMCVVKSWSHLFLTLKDTDDKVGIPLTLYTTRNEISTIKGTDVQLQVSVMIQTPLLPNETNHYKLFLFRKNYTIKSFPAAGNISPPFQQNPWECDQLNVF